MQIFDLTASSDEDVQTLSATVAWEDNDRENAEVFFQVYGNNGLINSSNYNAFLVACVPAALRYGERRIHIDGPVCPWLVNNLTTMMAYFNHWYWYDQGRQPGDTVQIEAKSYVSDETPREPRVGAFFSGGVDSLYTLRRNQLAMPEGHPGRIRDIIFLHGFDVFGNRPKRGPELDAFQYFIKECEPVARDANVNLIPVWTNVRVLGMEDNGFFVRECCGAVLGAVAHALSEKLTDVFIASSHHLSDIAPYGSTPLTDPRLSSLNLRMHYDTEHIKRIEKVKVVGDWQVGLDHLRVCFEGGPGTLNCGTCEKCLRTKLALLCAYRLDSTTAFQNNNLSVVLVLKGFEVTEATVSLSSELIHGLRQAGHHNLARAVWFKRVFYYAKKSLDVRGVCSWVDKHLLGGRMKYWFSRNPNPKMLPSPHRSLSSQ